jgi:integrase
MVLKLIPPRAGMSHSWRIRGAHLGQPVDQSAKTADRKLAAKVMATVKDDIEAGAFVRRGAPTFSDAALGYMKGGGNSRFVKPLLEHFQTTPLTAIDQRAIDQASLAIYPNGSPATRNRQVYTPMSAILRGAGVTITLKRPKGAGGVRRTAYLEPQQAFALIKAATEHDARFGALLAFLTYTGARLGEALALTWDDVSLDRGVALIRQTKTEGARTAVMPPNLLAAIDALSRRGQRVFGLTKCGRLYTRLEAASKAAGVPIPDRVAFHLFRHTWATWMRRYAGLDTAALVETGAWRSRQSASVYEHLDASEESKKVLRLPVAIGAGLV